jgi:hypothetical protein
MTNKIRTLASDPIRMFTIRWAVHHQYSYRFDTRHGKDMHLVGGKKTSISNLHLKGFTVDFDMC